MLHPRNDLPLTSLELLILGSYIILAEDPHSMTLKYVLPYQRRWIESFIALSKVAELFSFTNTSAHRLMPRKKKATCVSLQWQGFREILVHWMQAIMYMTNACTMLIESTKVASQKHNKNIQPQCKPSSSNPMLNHWSSWILN